MRRSTEEVKPYSTNVCSSPHRCETRPGPQYILRSYTFHRDGSFLLSLHTYRDPSCAHPARSLMARGNLTLGRPSWITPGGTEAEYTLSK
ncbi:Protein APCDD1-like [Portunus trituberculatus]|uniref:Protein APCDD1-like n=1 Tax=Portunus trituberculatus TaxID=210409 RepID=A0A5B7J367_PORTR|nr:Protein APCDD1-like [Portunus trituberculatus]